MKLMHNFRSILFIFVLSMLSLFSLEAQVKVVAEGSIHPTIYKPGEEVTLSIDRMPADYEEFVTLQNEVAQTPEGAVMMEIVAMEMYYRSPELGKKCLALANTEINVNFMVRRMSDLAVPEEQSGRPYQPAIFFSGATPMNGYNPTSPYTIQVRTSKVHKYEKSQSLRGYLLYLDIFSEGFDTQWRSVEVIKQKGSDVYKVYNCPAMVTRCKELDFESPRDYEGLK